MRTVILGKKIENLYGVNNKQKTIDDGNGLPKAIYTAKPTLNKVSMIKEWVEICSYDGEPRYNSERGDTFFAFNSKRRMNISESEDVAICQEVFRADLNEMHLRTDKVVEEIDIDKWEADANLSEQIVAFNEAMITSNEKLKSYCDVHKLSYGYTDAIELFNIVFPDEEYEIVDGVMKVKKTKYPEITLTSARDELDWSASRVDAISVYNNGSINITKAE